MSSTLASANPYLRDPTLRKLGVFKSVASSSAIEGIRAPFKKIIARNIVSTRPVAPAKA